MTNLNISTEKLKSLEDLLKSVNYDETRIIIDQKYFKEGGLVLYLRDRFKIENIRIELSKEEVIDMVDEYKDLDGEEFTWLRFLANNFQRERIFARILDVLIFKATDCLQYA